MNEFFTWAILGTYAGCVLATTLITQLVKEWGALKTVHTRLVSYVIALLILIGANAFAGTLTLETASQNIINAVVVALAANGGYDALSTVKANINKTE